MKYVLLLLFCTFVATGINRPVENVNRLVLLKPIKPKPIKVDPLVNALILVESSGNDSAIGDTHLPVPSIGCLQIRPIMVREVNRILKLKGAKVRFKLKDRFNRDKSVEMFMIWKEFHYEDADWEMIARAWNGGPMGYKKSRTLKYWKKVQQQLSENTLGSEK